MAGKISGNDSIRRNVAIAAEEPSSHVDDVFQPQYTVGDSQAERCQSLFKAALLAHFRAATMEHTAEKNSGVTVADRERSRQLLVSQSPHWRRERDFLATCAGYDPDEIRAAAVRLLASAGCDINAEEAQQRRRWRAARNRVNAERSRADYWLDLAISAGSDDMLARAAEIEAREVAARSSTAASMAPASPTPSPAASSVRRPRVFSAVYHEPVAVAAE